MQNNGSLKRGEKIVEKGKSVVGLDVKAGDDIDANDKTEEEKKPNWRKRRVLKGRR